MPISFTSFQRRALTVVLPFIAMLAVEFGAKAQQTSENNDFQSPAVSEEFYKSFSFNWTDAQGKEHTSNLAERATDPAHIVALLTEIYTNPAIPGFVYDRGADFIDDGRGDLANVPYKPCPFSPYHMDENREIATPASGATALIVEMKDNYNEGISGTIWDDNYGLRCLDAVKSVQLITKQMYVSEEVDHSANPGFLFNVEATLNKFFIITKGCNRPLATGYPLFYNMYEEFSPTNSGPMFNAFAQMDAGEQFPVDHNCSTIINQNHVVVMRPADGNDRNYAVNLMFYLPDFRFRGETRSIDNLHHYEYYTYYATDYQPYFFFNKIKASINGEVKINPTDEMREAWVPVTWVSSYKDITKSKVPEHFYIYRVVDHVFDANPIPASELFTDQEGTTIDADGGIIRSASHDVNLYVKEEQTSESKQVRYVVLGRRYGSEFSFVESNEVAAPIPGFDAVESLNIIIDGTPRSTYNIEEEKNVYSNSISLTDARTASGDRLLAGHIQVKSDGHSGTVFELRRYAKGEIDYVVVADMEVTGVTAKKWNDNTEGVWVYDALIRYANGVTPDGSAQFKSKMVIADPVQDDYQPIIALDNRNGVIANFIDNFDAETARGEHPQGYTYQMVFVPAHTASDEPVRSNTVDVTIPVRNLAVGYVPYTEAQILADNDATDRLPLNPIGVGIQTKKNTQVAGYTVIDVTKGNAVVAHAVRHPSGKFQRRVFDELGNEDDLINPNTSEGFYGRLPFRLIYPVDIDDEFALILEYSNGNTFGNVLTRLTPVPEPEVKEASLNYLMFQNGEFIYEGGLSWTSQDLPVTPWPAFEEQSKQYNVYDYNVWSQSPDSEIQHIYQVSGATNINLMEENDPHAKSIDSICFSSHIASEADPVELNHIVRLYASIPPELIIDFDSVTSGFVISETDSQAYTTQGPIISAIETVEAEIANGEARYFDTLGRAVDAESLTSGIYIRVVGNRSEKVAIR